MTRNIIEVLSLTLLFSAVAIGAFGCNQGLKGKETTEVLETPDGAMIVDTFKITAVVEAIDLASRKVTLSSPDGGKRSFKASPDVDLTKYKVGDRITLEATQEIAVALRKGGAPASAAAADAVAVATANNQAGLLMADTAEVTASITGVDRKKREVQLLFPDGSSRTVKVGKKVNLNNVDIGDSVTVQVAEALAIELKKS
jgi:hypothetical protein